ncbi:MAG TPA: hypothetical protein VHC69_10455 [Polyangiaceae bacterium]|nr:hypothetical protein [Polyangiaceae bacterium]
MTDVESFERAFVAVSYLLGRRDGAAEGIAGATEAAQRAARLTVLSNQDERAKRLAAELLPVVASFEKRRLG